MPNDNYIQNEKDIARAHDYHNRALAMFDQGFTSEAARKDALDYLNRAYEILVTEAINYGLWSQRTRAADDSEWIWDDEGARLIYEKYNVPALHVWADKHATLYTDFPAVVKQANVLRADRDAIKALPIKEKPKSRTRALQEARNAVAKTCQICGRPILAERGKIAHHGYQRPGEGWQTASCYGAMELPFEVSRDCLGSYIKLLVAQVERTNAELASVANEEIAIWVNYGTGKYQGRQEIKGSFLAKRETYDASRDQHRPLAYHWSTIPTTFDEVRARELKQLKRRLEDEEAYLVGQQVRYNDWKPAKVPA